MVDLNPRGPGEAWNARCHGGSSGCGAGGRHGRGGPAGGGERSAERSALCGRAGEEEAESARRSSEFMATVEMRRPRAGVGRSS